VLSPVAYTFILLLAFPLKEIKEADETDKEL
jgi:hypothetical protein